MLSITFHDPGLFALSTRIVFVAAPINAPWLLGQWYLQVESNSGPIFQLNSMARGCPTAWVSLVHLSPPLSHLTWFLSCPSVMVFSLSLRLHGIHFPVVCSTWKDRAFWLSWGSVELVSTLSANEMCDSFWILMNRSNGYRMVGLGISGSCGFSVRILASGCPSLMLTNVFHQTWSDSTCSSIHTSRFRSFD